jgi:hypothetical protein
MKKIIILLITFLVLLTTTYACKETYDTDEYVVIIDVIEDSGINASCNITIYNVTSMVVNATMTQNESKYLYNASILPVDTYSSYIVCNKTGFEYLGECKFKVEEGRNMIYIIYFGLALAIILLGIGLFKQDFTFLNVSGIMFLILGVWFGINGFNGVTNLITIAFTTMFIGLGGYIMIRTNIESI